MGPVDVQIRLLINFHAIKEPLITPSDLLEDQ